MLRLRDVKFSENRGLGVGNVNSQIEIVVPPTTARAIALADCADIGANNVADQQNSIALFGDGGSLQSGVARPVRDRRSQTHRSCAPHEQKQVSLYACATALTPARFPPWDRNAFPNRRYQADMECSNAAHGKHTRQGDACRSEF